MSSSARAALSSNQTQRYKAVIRSPVNGVVLARQIDAGQTVAASFNTPTLFVIAEDLSAMELQVAIDEADVGSVKQGQPATFTVDAFPGQDLPRDDHPRRSRLEPVGAGRDELELEQHDHQSQVVSYAATLSVANADQQLRPGMTATAEIITKARPNVLLVPNAALRFTPGAAAARARAAARAASPARSCPAAAAAGAGGAAQKSATMSRGAQQTVYILGEDGKPQPVQVTTGDTDGTVTEVTGGDLEAGDEGDHRPARRAAAAASGARVRAAAPGRRRPGRRPGRRGGQSGGQ